MAPQMSMNILTFFVGVIYIYIYIYIYIDLY